MPIYKWLQILKELCLPICLLLTSACAPVRLQVSFDPEVGYGAENDRAVGNGSIFQAATSVRLFEDTKAFRVGDLLSVFLSESTNASKSAETSTAKNDEIDLEVSALLGSEPTFDDNPLFTNAYKGERGFSGTGESAQSNNLDGEIAVIVTSILPNGNLMINGEKMIELNQGSEIIRLSGLVRPQDISPDNTVFSRKLANAKIYYGSGGVLANANTKGWLSRLFDNPKYPY